MTHEEYIDLFHKAQVNLVAFKPVFHCDDELRRMVEMAVEAERDRIANEAKDIIKRAEARGAAKEREAVLDLVDAYAKNNTDLADAIRARGES